MVNTLFKSQVSRRSAGWSRDEKIPKTVDVKAVSHGEQDVSESERMRETLIASFVLAVGNEECWASPHIHHPRAPWLLPSELSVLSELQLCQRLLPQQVLCARGFDYLFTAPVMSVPHK